jgi:hypothetical protein
MTSGCTERSQRVNPVRQTDTTGVQQLTSESVIEFLC